MKKLTALLVMLCLFGVGCGGSTSSGPGTANPKTKPENSPSKETHKSGAHDTHDIGTMKHDTGMMKPDTASSKPSTTAGKDKPVDGPKMVEPKPSSDKPADKKPETSKN